MNLNRVAAIVGVSLCITLLLAARPKSAALANNKLLPIAAMALPANGGTCTSDVSLQVIFAPGSNGTNLIYGDRDGTYSSEDLFNRGTIYTDGAEGVDAKLQVCNGSNDFVLNMDTGSNARFFNIAFTDQLEPPDLGATNLYGQTDHAGHLIAMEVASLSVGGSLNTCVTTQLGPTVYFWNPAVWATAPGGTHQCNASAIATIANNPNSTSLVTATHPTACTWIIQPQPSPLFASSTYVAGLVENVRKTGYTSGGQYNLPFAIKLVKLTCP